MTPTTEKKNPIHFTYYEINSYLWDPEKQTSTIFLK